MKKTVRFIFATMFFAGIGSVAAQSHYYHLEGDTVRGRCPIYYYSWWPTLNANGMVEDSLVNVRIPREKCMYHCADSTLRIIGIASTLMHENKVTHQEEMNPQLAATYNYVLYKATPGGLVELVRVDIVPDYETHPKRYMALPKTLRHENCSNFIPETIIAPLREYYFSSPITVTDSFYLGTYYNMNVSFENNELGSAQLSYQCNHWVLYDNMQLVTSETTTPPSPCDVNLPIRKFIDFNHLNELSRTTEKGYVLVFPIIEVDTVGLPYDTAFFACYRPEKIQYIQLLETAIRVEWLNEGHSEWMVSVVAAGGDPDTGRIQHTTVLHTSFYGLSTDTTYDIYVRGLCRFGWSDWSVPIRYIPQGYHPQNIEEAEPSLFILAPNPAKGLVVIESESALVGVAEVIDLQGKTLISAPLSGSHTPLDISTLPTGNYLVRINTAQGSATRKLSIL